MPEDMPDLDPEGFGEPLESEALLLDIQGYEGPLDLLLALARKQRVDLRNVSILQLAEQYLGFVAEARRLRIELAADYLVMAAWLAFLKSRLLLPPDRDEDGPVGRGAGGAAPAPAGAAGGDPQGRDAADGARPARPGHVRPRRAGDGGRGEPGLVERDAGGLAEGLCAAVLRADAGAAPDAPGAGAFAGEGV
jgi:hypothetical protein